MQNYIIDRYIFRPVHSNMYVITRDKKALVIDPIDCDEIVEKLKLNRIMDITVLLTHEHYDHTNGIPRLMENFKIKLICHDLCAKAIKKGRNNRPVVIASMLMKNRGDLINFNVEDLPGNYFINADETFFEITEFFWQGIKVKMVPTPGHTSGSCCIEIDDKYLFTGDSLLEFCEVITRFPTGSKIEYDEVTKPYLMSVSDDFIVMPGHGEQFLISEIQLIRR